MAAFNRLSGATMRTISSQWIDDTDTRKVLEAHAKTRALVPDIEEAHQAILAALESSGTATLDAQVAQLRAEGDALDLRHDRKYRGTYKLLDALAELADEPDTATALLALRDRLHPKGLAQVNTTWADEAGNAATVRAGIDKATRTQLKAIGSNKGRTIDDEVQAWLQAADRLGPLGAQKAAAEHQVQHAKSAPETPAMNAARNAWIKVARALESSLDLVKGLPSAHRSAVLGLLYDSAAKAERRSAGQRKGAPDEPTPPTTPSTP